MAEVDNKYISENVKLRNRIDLMRGNYEAMETNLQMNEHIRKVQQQQIIHLKGNMRVYCRVKPPLEERNSTETKMLSLPKLLRDENGEIVKSPQNHLELRMPKYGGGFHAPIAFNYDHVFLREARQDEIFEDIKPFVQTALDGEHTCIFAYGQTGSGKTHTMEGAGEQMHFDEQWRPTEHAGILPRVAVFIQAEIKRLKRQFSRDVSIEVSALEIYCDVIRDLLGDGIVEIRNLGANRVSSIGQTWVPVASPAEFLQQIHVS
jgi:kinesin family member C1